MTVYEFPDRGVWAQLCERPKADTESLNELVAQIFDEVKRNGDLAVAKYSELFDGSALTEFGVKPVTIENSSAILTDDLKDAMQLAKSNISKFQEPADEKVVIETMPGVKCWSEKRAIDRVGIYIPGGSAPLFSTVLMLGIPAKLAGCREVALFTPSDRNGNINPAILHAAKIVGITEIYAIGGIQAVAAMTLGTRSIAKVDKIFGPGNQYVTAAKLFAQQLGTPIDMPAGPSEVLVIADEFANAEFVASDLLSQAEHGPDSQVLLVATDATFVSEVEKAIARQIEELPRKEIARKALSNSSAIVLESLSSCVEFSNYYAPEHLILAIEDPENIVSEIKNAGSVFLGRYSCESAGDYASGTNHTLPTNGSARSYSGVSTDSFTKKISFQQLSFDGLKNIGPSVIAMAEAESLQAHANAVSIRLKSQDYV